MTISPLAGQYPPPAMLVNVAKLVTAYFSETPDPGIAAQQVVFGTSGHRGCAFTRSFNEAHVLAITQAICLYRRAQGIGGPLYLGMDTHALSEPALVSALEVLAANGVTVMLATGGEYTPTPVISHAILAYNRRHKPQLADGIILTPSHNPPEDGGIKYNPPHGGPADSLTTHWIEKRANEFLQDKLRGVRRMPYAQACRANTTHAHDYLSPFVADLGEVVDMDAIRGAGIRLGADPLGGAGVHYWQRIGEHYQLDLTVINQIVDPCFRFIPLDRDGRIRMDPASPSTMQPLVAMKQNFDIAFACDPDHDRHGIVTPSAGLLPPNHYLAAAIHYLCQHRPHWPQTAAIGKTMVTTEMIDRVAKQLGRPLYEVPVGFKWFVPGLANGTLAFAGEESAGATFLRRNGQVWTTDKDGFAPALLAAEMTARTGQDPGDLYRHLAASFGPLVSGQHEAPATLAQRQILAKLSSEAIPAAQLAGEAILTVATTASGNGAALGGIKISTAHGWFAARPSGTEAIYKIYAESALGDAHLQRLLTEAQSIVDTALETLAAPSPPAQ